MTDILDKLNQFVAGNSDYYNLFVESREEISKLRKQKQDLIVAFRVNMMRCYSEYTHEDFDKKIEEILSLSCQHKWNESKTITILLSSPGQLERQCTICNKKQRRFENQQEWSDV